MLCGKGWSLAKTQSLHTFFSVPLLLYLLYIVSQYQPHKCEAWVAGTSRSLRDPDLSHYAVLPWQARQSQTTVFEKHSHYCYYHLPSFVSVQPAARCLIAGPVGCPICKDDDKLDQLLNNVYLNQTWMLVVLVMWILLWHRCLWLLGPPTDEPRRRRVWHSLRELWKRGTKGGLPVSSLFYAKWCYMYQRLSHDLPPWLYNNKGDWSEIRGCGWVWETITLITMALPCVYVMVNSVSVHGS